MEKFDFKEALAFMNCGMTVLGPGSRKYTIENGELICYPLPFTRPKHRRVEVRLHTDIILSKEWQLFDDFNQE